MEDFYNAMTTYINSKKPKEICLARTIKKNGWETCLDCRSRLSRIFCDDIYSQVGGYNITEPKENRLPKIRETMLDMMYAISRKGGMWEGVCRHYEPPEAGLPRELFDHKTELCTTCLDTEKNIKCHRRSLCAALLWKKVKSLYPKLMTLTEFSKRVGVSVPTIKKLIKEPRFK